MGVYSLASHVNECSAGTSTTLHADSAAPPLLLVIDGLAFLHFVARYLPGVTGGDYAELRLHTRRWVESWRRLGLEPAHWVWDGT